jgi:hypothetical protein
LDDVYSHSMADLLEEQRGSRRDLLVLLAAVAGGRREAKS